MTVCVAVSFRWTYGANDIGTAVLTASDRQITAGDVEYEPPQTKICFLTPRTIILVGGAYQINSEALLYTQRALLETPEAGPGVIAELYASFIRDIKSRFAYQTHLGPLGLTKAEFLAQQRELSTDFVSKITMQVQNFQSEDTEALVVGSDDRNTYIYLVDQNSHVTLHNDVGFAAIGLGAWHAKSQLMRIPYTNQSDYAAALGLIYSAKKAAEVAPGVGKHTDMFVVNRMGWLPVPETLKERVATLYSDFEARQRDLAVEAIIGVRNYLIDLHGASGQLASMQSEGQDHPSPKADQSPPPP